MNDGLHLSGQGGALVKSFEGCLRPIDQTKTQFKPYICPAGVLTIGWGHTNDNGRKFTSRDIWTKGECDAEFRSDMRRFEAAVRRRVRVELTQPQFDALVSFTYNCGEGNLSKSGLLRKVNAEDFEGAVLEFAKWNRGGGKVLAGLTRRRAAEAKLFETGNHAVVHAEYAVAAADSDEPMPQQVDAPEGTAKSMASSKIGNAQIGIGAAGLVEGASAVNDAASQATALKQNAHELGIMDVLSTLVTSPVFWVAVAIVIAAGATWYWRREHAQAGV
jgi:lysozyme